MPLRTDEHVIADLAVGAVTRIVHECKWACERVVADYGEDLLVQPTVDEEVDHCRIWIQVKGTRELARFQRSDGHLTLSVDFDHALKWIRSADLVVVVLWDVEQGIGYWTLPLECVDQWDLYALQTKQASLRFGGASRFTQETLKWLGWRAREHHYSMLLSDALVDAEIAHSMGINNGTSGRAQSRVPLIAFDFLSRLGVVTTSGVHEDVMRMYKNILPQCMPEPGEGTTPEIMAGTMAMIGRLDAVAPGLGLGGSAIEEFGRVATLMILEELDPGAVASGRIFFPGVRGANAG